MLRSKSLLVRYMCRVLQWSTLWHLLLRI
uniref:Uncharacterized protein n=1 Tax=Arundo donax TaxID=35708 RepID=A0A0A9GND5_ARUDO